MLIENYKATFGDVGAASCSVGSSRHKIHVLLEQFPEKIWPLLTWIAEEGGPYVPHVSAVDAIVLLLDGLGDTAAESLCNRLEWSVLDDGIAAGEFCTG